MPAVLFSRHVNENPHHNLQWKNLYTSIFKFIFSEVYRPNWTNANLWVHKVNVSPLMPFNHFYN